MSVPKYKYGAKVLGPSVAYPDKNPEPEPGWSRWIERGVFYTAPIVDPSKFGGHAYDNGGFEKGICDCPCGCYMGRESSSGPVDPFGACPENPNDGTANSKFMKTPKTKQPTLSDIFNTDSLVFWSFRYFLGRTTAATCVFAGNLAKAWPLLDDITRVAISAELEHAFGRDDEMRADTNTKYSYYPLGHDCNRESWELVRKAYKKQ